MRRHDRTRVRDFYCGLKRLQVNLAQRPLGRFKPLAIRARPRFAVGDEMYRRGDDFILGETRVAFALRAVDVSHGQPAYPS